LGVIAAEGLLMFLKEIIVQASAVTRLRTTSFRRILMQEKKWFDKTENPAPTLIQTLVKDGDDARSLISTIMACLVVITMLGFGFIWASFVGDS
jgi:ATP-binding cassette, subfamily B (MDR/TAP), member 1